MSIFETVIIGSGTAAVHAVKSMRTNGFQEKICLITNSSEPTYNPMLTTYYIAGKISLEQCYPYGFNFDVVKHNNVDLWLGDPVIDLNAEKQTIKTNSGKRISYKKCLIAAGASPIMPNIFGIQSSRVFTLRTMEDAARLKEMLTKKPKKVLIVGASMVGIKLVEIFNQLNADITLVDLGKKVFPLAASDKCAEMIEQHLLSQGINLLLGTAVSGIEEYSHGIRVYFSKGHDPQDYDLAIMCIGTKANTDFLNPEQVCIDKGIIVNSRMETSAPNLYAAGDVTQGTNLLNNKKEIIGLWANANYQGRTAGTNIAGVKVEYPGSIPCNISHFLNMVFVSIGNPKFPGKIIEHIDRGNNTYLRLVRDDEKLVGVNSINYYHTAGMYKQILLKDLV